jgi:hypothetical protein
MGDCIIIIELGGGLQSLYVVRQTKHAYVSDV